MNLEWCDNSWNEYLAWQLEDKKTLKRINELIKDISRNGVSKGIGKPEMLSQNRSGWWSRRIDSKNRLVYTIKNDKLYIVSCKNHYDDK